MPVFTNAYDLGLEYGFIFNRNNPLSRNLYATFPLLDFRPTVISDLHQLFIYVLIEG